MSNHEIIRALKYPQIRNIYPHTGIINPANVARHASESRNMKMMTRVKAGAPAPSAQRDRCTTTV